MSNFKSEIASRKSKVGNRLLAPAVSLVVLAIVLLLASQPVPEKPVKDGTGPLAVRLDPWKSREKSSRNPEKIVRSTFGMVWQEL